MQWAALELGAHDIAVNAVIAGLIDTALTRLATLGADSAEWARGLSLAGQSRLLRSARGCDAFPRGLVPIEGAGAALRWCKPCAAGSGEGPPVAS